MSKKIRLNITVDKNLAEKARKKLNLFGGKMSTLFNAYLRDFADSIEKDFSQSKEILSRIENIEERLKKLERGIS